METMPAESRTDRLEAVFGACVPKEFSAESVVPDTMPDIDRILDAETAIYIRSKSIDDGEVTLDGVITAVVLFSAAEDESVHKLELSVPVSIECRDGEIQSRDVLLSDTAVTASEAKMLNPRKIVLRAETVSEIRLLRTETLELSCSGTDSPGTQLLKKPASIGYITSVSEKTFTVNEEIPLPDRASLDELLSFHAQVAAEDMKKVGSRAVLQGMVLLSVLYTKEEDGTLVQQSFSVPFSQILEAPPEDVTASVQLRQSACYLEPIPGLNGASSLSLEMHLTAQLVFTAVMETEYVADAYSLRGLCTADHRTVTVCGRFAPTELRCTTREHLDAPEGVKRVISVYPSASLPAIAEKAFRIPLIVRVLFLGSDDRQHHAVKRIAAEIPADDSFGAQVYCSQVIFREANASAAPDGLDIRLETELRFIQAAADQIHCVCAIETDDGPQIAAGEGPSLIVVRPGGASVWDLAKKFRSTCALIEESNPGGIDPDKLILIPRARR